LYYFIYFIYFYFCKVIISRFCLWKKKAAKPLPSPKFEYFRISTVQYKDIIIRIIIIIILKTDARSHPIICRCDNGAWKPYPFGWSTWLTSTGNDECRPFWPTPKAESTRVQRVVGHSERTSQPPAHHEGWMRKWSGNSFLLASSSLANHGG
jgi:hypothetical protein